MSWDTYVHQIQNTFDAASNSWANTNVCQYACVYGHDGACWAASQGFQLATYEFEMDQGDGTNKKVLCNEHQALMKATEGTRNGGQECGIRICNQKYMFLRNMEENGVKYAILTRTVGGGATVAKTGKALLVGVWGKEVNMGNGKAQNTGECTKNVLMVAKSLNDAGY